MHITSVRQRGRRVRSTARSTAPWPMRAMVGLAAGVAIASVDNFWSRGEVSPIVIVVLLVLATASAAAFWGVRGWVCAIVAWACVPLAHAIKHLLGMPDTLHPNTYLSVLYLAIFTLAVAIIGFGFGLLVSHSRRSAPL